MSNTKIVFCMFLLGATLCLAADRIPTKQLAGPPEEFLTGVMSHVDPAEIGIRSKSAMLPIALENMGNDTWTWRGDVAVDGTDTFNMMVFSGQDENWRVELREPGARKFRPISEWYSDYKQTFYGYSENRFPGEHFTFEEMTRGNWTMKIVAEAPLQTRGYLLYGTTGPYRLHAYSTGADNLVGNTLGFIARGLNAETGLNDDSLVRTAYMTVKGPFGEETRYPMFDDGRHNDDLAGDGIFGADFIPEETGDYQVQIVARGLTPEGQPFLRTAEHAVSVMAPEVILRNQVAKTRLTDDDRLSISLEVDTFEGGREKFRVFAEVWGKDELDNDTPVAWVGGMVYAENGELALTLDGRWIALADAMEPFQLRNLRIEDPDNFVAMARAELMELRTNELPKSAFGDVKTISDDMLMGPRPVKTSQNKAGHTLMVVHGYCSGDVWGGNMGNFSNATKFQDFNQSRSHDAFAQKIQQQGAGFDGYGIVAHSQGGCAALHLYTYYWSGLDNTTSGSRLIQSVGTPYQGTALAGNLAAIGQVFGAGCGTNNDLTYSGASSWLNGIPTWARNAVNYYTTSFETKWWRYDYCHLATDLFLSDPEDGTTEKSKGQLSNGVNRGHKTKQCHTNSMRDPGQCTDSGRNGTMSSYAKR